MKFLNEWWGVNNEISPMELAARSLVMFLIALVLVRYSGMRPFGKGNAFDNIITILLGGVLSRGVVGATPFFSAVAGGIVIILVHKILAKASYHNKVLEFLTKGKSLILYSNNSFVKENMEKANITKEDIREELRLRCNICSFDTIEEVFIEKTGELSFIKKIAGD